MGDTLDVKIKCEVLAFRATLILKNSRPFVEEKMPQTDTQLVDATLAGNTNAFGQLVQKYQGAVYGLAVHKIRDFAEAKDIAQEVFFEAYRNLAQMSEGFRFHGLVSSRKLNLDQRRIRLSNGQVYQMRHLFDETS